MVKLYIIILIQALRVYDAADAGSTPPDWKQGDQKLLAQFFTPDIFRDQVHKLTRKLTFMRFMIARGSLFSNCNSQPHIGKIVWK